MRVAILALIVVIAAMLTGCGGGGGAGGSSAGITQVPSDIVGTWRVPGMGLPNDELGVQTNGDVVVNSETATSRSDSQARIGTCSPQGVLSLNGGWRHNGVDYSINASGSVQSQSHSMTLHATIVESTGGRHEGQVINGDRVSDIELPPPPPGDDPGTGSGGDGGIELPPPPPGYDPGTGDGGIELPPPPPSY